VEKVEFRTENCDDHMYYYDSSKSIVSQCIINYENNYLINVRKTYTNNIYFGVNFTTFNKIQGLLHHFKCKDRPLGKEDVVEDKELFSTHFKNYSLHINEELENDSNYVKQNFNLNSTIYFCYDKYSNYKYTLISDKENLWRGFYRSDSNPPKTEEEINTYIAVCEKSLSNTIHTVSTEYSNVIIEHSTQYIHEWSDIKRRQHANAQR
jgi:hypothetical protein